MTRPMTRGDIFRQQAIRCCVRRRPTTSRACPPRPNRTSSRVSASVGGATISHPRPRTDVFLPSPPPPHRSAPCPRLRFSWASAPGRRWRSSPRRLGRPPAGRRAGSRRALQVQERDGRQPKPFVRPTARPADPCPECGRRGQGGVPAMSRPRAHELPRPRPCSPRRCGRSGARTAAARGGCLRSVSGPGKLRAGIGLADRGRIAPY